MLANDLKSSRPFCMFFPAFSPRFFCCTQCFCHEKGGGDRESLSPLLPSEFQRGAIKVSALKCSGFNNSRQGIRKFFFRKESLIEYRKKGAKTATSALLPLLPQNILELWVFVFELYCFHFPHCFGSKDPKRTRQRRYCLCYYSF